MAAKQITDGEIRKRLDRLKFAGSDAQPLQSLRPWAQQADPEFVKKVNDYRLGNFKFAAIIRSNNSRQQVLEGDQTGCVTALSNGHPTTAYGNERVSIGAIHTATNIAAHRYISSFRLHVDFLFPLSVSNTSVEDSKWN